MKYTLTLLLLLTLPALANWQVAAFTGAGVHQRTIICHAADPGPATMVWRSGYFLLYSGSAVNVSLFDGDGLQATVEMDGSMFSFTRIPARLRVIGSDLACEYQGRVTHLPLTPPTQAAQLDRATAAVWQIDDTGQVTMTTRHGTTPWDPGVDVEHLALRGEDEVLITTGAYLRGYDRRTLACRWQAELPAPIRALAVAPDGTIAAAYWID